MQLPGVAFTLRGEKLLDARSRITFASKESIDALIGVLEGLKKCFKDDGTIEPTPDMKPVQPENK